MEDGRHCVIETVLRHWIEKACEGEVERDSHRRSDRELVVRSSQGTELRFSVSAMTLTEFLLARIDNDEELPRDMADLADDVRAGNQVGKHNLFRPPRNDLPP